MSRYIKYCTSILMVLMHVHLCAQSNKIYNKEGSIWYFGSIGQAFNFITGDPEVLVHQHAMAGHQGGVMTMCNSAGHVLFYSNSKYLYDSTNTKRGADLKGDLTQIPSIVATQDFNDTNVYYIFTQSYDQKMYVSKIQLNYNSISPIYYITFIQNPTLLDDSVATFSVVNSGDKQGTWVVVKNIYSNKYSSYLLSSTGLNSTPVVSYVGITPGAVALNNSVNIGIMKIAPSGRYITLIAGGKAQVADFDNITGKISNPKLLHDEPDKLFNGLDTVRKVSMGIDYSPNEQFIYTNFSTIYDHDNYTEYNVFDTVFQWDISLPTEEDIKSNEVVIYSYYYGTSFFGKPMRSGGDFELGPDGRLYFAQSFSNNKIGRINNPNQKGKGCGLQWDELTISGLNGNRAFPEFNRSILQRPDFKVNRICYGDTTFLYISDTSIIDSVRWDFGDINSGPNNISSGYRSYHVFTDSGEYTVKADIWINPKSGFDLTSWHDTISVKVRIYSFPQYTSLKDTNLCAGDTLKYLANPALSYKWSTGVKDSVLQVTDTGTYWLQMSNYGCAIYDTFQVKAQPKYNIQINDTFTCETDTFKISTAVLGYKWSHGNYDSIVSFVMSGVYYVEAGTGDCYDKDTVTINFYAKPLFNLGSDTLICNTDSITLSGTSGVKHFWNTGDTTQNITIKTAGEYILKQSTQYCDYSDTINIAVQQQPNFFIGNDTVVCIGQKVIIGTTIPNGIKYTWNNRGDATPKITTDTQSTYSVIAYDGICRAYDTIFVGVYTPQSIELGQDSTLCAGTVTLLDGTINRGKYLWNDGVQTPTRLITQSGNYSVLVTDSVCQYSDAITINFNPVPPLELGEDTFLCQDEVHQVFVNPQWEGVMWNDGNTDYSRIFTTEGKYLVTADYLNCQSTDSITINYYPPLPTLDLGADQDVCDPLFYLLESSYHGYYGIQWQDGSREPEYQVTETGDYIISTKPHRCGQVSDTIHITFLKELCDLHVPTAFSPNGDGRNDTFFPIGYQAEVENMRIYNRWGELLFDGVTPWDGTYKGEPVPQGNYLYIITYKKEHRGGKKRVFTKGTVQVLR